MAGHFELVTDQDGNCLVRLVDGRGEELAISIPFTSSSAAIDGINSFREVAATAPIRDHTSSAYRRRVKQHEQAAPQHDGKIPLGQPRRLRQYRRH
jgi:uncharacterized protein YegP (UPF0339 family)